MIQTAKAIQEGIEIPLPPIPGMPPWFPPIPPIFPAPGDLQELLDSISGYSGWFNLIVGLYMIRLFIGQTIDIRFYGVGRWPYALGGIMVRLNQYGIYDANSSRLSSFLLKVLYYGVPDVQHIEGAVFNHAIQNYSDASMLTFVHHRWLHNPNYRSHYVHIPSIDYTNLNAQFPITLQIPAPNFSMLILFFILNINIVSNGIPVVLLLGTPNTFIIHGVLKDVQDL
jgi:hypothetical protein